MNPTGWNGYSYAARSAFEQRLAREKVEQLKAMSFDEQCAYARSITDRAFAESAWTETVEGVERLMQPDIPAFADTVRRAEPLSVRGLLDRDPLGWKGSGHAFVW